MQDALVARIQKIFRFFNFEKIPQRLHKAPKVPRSAFTYVWGIRGNGAGHRYQNTKVHGRRRNPSLYLIKEPWREESYRKYFERSRTTSPHIYEHCREAARAKALRPLCGAPSAALTQASLPGRFSAMWGMERCATQALTVRGYDRSPAPYHDRRFSHPGPPVWDLNAVLRLG